MRRALPNDFDEALAVIEEDITANGPTQDELEVLIYEAADWLMDPRGRRAPEVNRSIGYTFRGEDVELTFEWLLITGIIRFNGFRISGGVMAEALSKHQFLAPPDFRFQQVERGLDLMQQRYAMLGAPADLPVSQWNIDSFPRFVEAIDALNFRVMLESAEEHSTLAPGDPDPDPEETARSWWLLGYWTHILETQTIRSLADDRTISERSLMSLKADAARRRGGKARGQYQSAEAVALRSKILERAAPIRAKDPSINDDDLIDAVRDQLTSKVGSSTVRAHIRALKREGLLPGRRIGER
jgi:hypothetical protein